MNRRAARFPLGLDQVVPGGSASPGRSLLRPQRPLEDARVAEDAVHRAVPTGQGLDSEAVRARMVDRLRQQGVESPAVLRAMGQVPRHSFIDSAFAVQAYEDTSLPIGWGQTISKPIVVARMLDLLARAPGAAKRPIRAPLGRALEVGAGCGYQAAVMARLASRVTTLERLQPLSEKARAHLSAQGVENVRVLHADGVSGHPPNAPYDSIVAAAAGQTIPQAWLDQLALGGRLVAPTGDASGEGQMLVVIDRDAAGWHRQVHDAVRFVPLKSGQS